MELNNTRDVLMAALSQEQGGNDHHAGQNDDQDIEMLFSVMT
ncbi:MAG: hypothetical protein PHC60_02000 [Heliobacteriaceae bacterium]|nr:hypothetical protein [Heliobacteriaceae bacterium]MDD4587151.1 hypothetical protein [Heliobacteriaceae bacterium]